MDLDVPPPSALRAQPPPQAKNQSKEARKVPLSTARNSRSSAWCHHGLNRPISTYPRACNYIFYTCGPTGGGTKARVKKRSREEKLLDASATIKESCLGKFS